MDTNSFYLLGDNILIRPVKQEPSEKKTDSGLLLVDNSPEAPVNSGEVVYVGNGRVLDNGMVLSPGVNVGDIAFYRPYVTEAFSINGEELMLIKVHDLFGCIPAKPAEGLPF